MGLTCLMKLVRLMLSGIQIVPEDEPLHNYTRPITLGKRYLRFYRCHGPYMFDETGKVFCI